MNPLIFSTTLSLNGEHIKTIATEFLDITGLPILLSHSLHLNICMEEGPNCNKYFSSYEEKNVVSLT